MKIKNTDNVSKEIPIMHVKVLEVGLNIDNKEAFLVESISGKNKGSQSVLTSYESHDSSPFNSYHLNGLKTKEVKVGESIILSDIFNINKYADIPVISAYRAVKITGDFKSKESLMITAITDDKLKGHLLNPEKGSHAIINGTQEEKIKKVKVMISSLSLSDAQGVIIIIASKNNEKTTSVQAFISPYLFHENKSPELLDKKDFLEKVDTFISEGSMTNFLGTLTGSFTDVIESQDLVIAVVPAKAIRMDTNRENSLINGRSKAFRVGISSLGVDVHSQFESPFIKRETIGGLGLIRGNFLNQITSMDDNEIVSRLTNQISFMKEENLQTINTTYKEPKKHKDIMLKMIDAGANIDFDNRSEEPSLPIKNIIFQTNKISEKYLFFKGIEIMKKEYVPTEGLKSSFFERRSATKLSKILDDEMNFHGHKSYQADRGSREVLEIMSNVINAYVKDSDLQAKIPEVLLSVSSFLSKVEQETPENINKLSESLNRAKQLFTKVELDLDDSLK